MRQFPHFYQFLPFFIYFFKKKFSPIPRLLCNDGLVIGSVSRNRPPPSSSSNPEESVKSVISKIIYNPEDNTKVLSLATLFPQRLRANAKSPSAFFFYSAIPNIGRTRQTFARYRCGPAASKRKAKPLLHCWIVWS